VSCEHCTPLPLIFPTPVSTPEVSVEVYICLRGSMLAPAPGSVTPAADVVLLPNRLNLPPNFLAPTS
jgi:hypothetical protein